MGSPWHPSVEQIRDGEAVAAGVASRPDRQLTDRTQYLKDRVDGAEMGEAIFAREQSCSADCQVGTPVFWNPSTGRFEPAQAAAEIDPETDDLVASVESEVVGLVYQKFTATSADIVLLGRVELDLGLAVGGQVFAGRYYLSAEIAGRLVKSRQPLGPLVCFADGQGVVYVLCQQHRFVEEHTHYAIELHCRPAGATTAPTEGGRHEITAADADQAGWLPADHVLFDNQAPSGAAFGYNLSQHPELDRIWPPVPTSAVQLVWDKGDGRVGGTIVPNGPNGLVIVDRHGIWWMSNCFGDVPWPTMFNNEVSSSESSQSLECERDEYMSLSIYFVRMNALTDRSAVLSLETDSESGYRFVDDDGNTASVGHLKLVADGDSQVTDSELAGSVVLKEVAGKTFKRGPVTEGLTAGSNITLSGSTQKTVGSTVVHMGIVEIAAQVEAANLEVPLQLVAVDDVRERLYEDVMYLGFPSGQGSSIRGKLKVPVAGLPANPQLKLRLAILGRASGTLPDLNVSYRRIPRATSPSSLPLTDTSLGFDPTEAVSADEYVEKETDGFSIAAGDVVFFTIERVTDAYGGEVGLLDLVGVLYAG